MAFKRMRYKRRVATAAEVARWPKLTCQACVAETRGDVLNASQLRSLLHAKGWRLCFSTGRDFCPVCVRMGLMDDPDFNPSLAKG